MSPTFHAAAPPTPAEATDSALSAEADARADASAESAAAPEQARNRAPVTWLGFTLPGPVSDGVHYFRESVISIRRRVNDALPAAIVNRGSNIAAGIHTVAEVFMFKANGTELMKGGNRSNPLHYVWYPLKNIYRSVSGDAKLMVSGRDLLRPAHYLESFKNHIDLKKATAIDIMHGPLINRWQARATLIGMTAWGLNLVLPDRKDTPEETERMSIMLATRPLAYMGERIKEAFWIPGWVDHKRQMTGLGILVAGVCSFLGGWRNVSRPKGGPQHYYFNWQYCATGLVSMAASIPMFLGIDNDKGYSQSGAIHLLRTLFLPGSIYKKFTKSERQGAYYYAAGHVGFQLDNATQMLIGGAEKRPDGSIVDHQEMREAAKTKAQEVKQQMRAAKEARRHAKSGDGRADEPAMEGTAEVDKLSALNLRPTAQVTNAQKVHRAMPEPAAMVAVQ